MIALISMMKAANAAHLMGYHSRYNQHTRQTPFVIAYGHLQHWLNGWDMADLEIREVE